MAEQQAPAQLQQAQPQQQQNNKVSKEELHVSVLSAGKKLYEGLNASVSSFNRIGPFDILPMHENFISLIKDKVILADKAGVRKEFVCENGLLEVSGNKVRVFIGI